MSLFDGLDMIDEGEDTTAVVEGGEKGANEEETTTSSFGFVSSGGNGNDDENEAAEAAAATTTTTTKPKTNAKQAPTPKASPAPQKEEKKKTPIAVPTPKKDDAEAKKKKVADEEQHKLAAKKSSSSFGSRFKSLFSSKKAATPAEHEAENRNSSTNKKESESIKHKTQQQEQKHTETNPKPAKEHRETQAPTVPAAEVKEEVVVVEEEEEEEEESTVSAFAFTNAPPSDTVEEEQEVAKETEQEQEQEQEQQEQQYASEATMPVFDLGDNDDDDKEEPPPLPSDDKEEPPPLPGESGSTAAVQQQKQQQKEKEQQPQPPKERSIVEKATDFTEEKKAKRLAIAEEWKSRVQSCRESKGKRAELLISLNAIKARIEEFQRDEEKAIEEERFDDAELISNQLSEQERTLGVKKKKKIITHTQTAQDTHTNSLMQDVEMEYIDSYVDYFKSYNGNVEFLEKQMATETEYYEKTKEYSVTGTLTHKKLTSKTNSSKYFVQETETKLGEEFDKKSKDIMQSIEDDLERISQKYVDEKKYHYHHKSHKQSTLL